MITRTSQNLPWDVIAWWISTGFNHAWHRRGGSNDKPCVLGVHRVGGPQAAQLSPVAQAQRAPTFERQLGTDMVEQPPRSERYQLEIRSGFIELEMSFIRHGDSTRL
jgi:hypothetical protein